MSSGRNLCSAGRKLAAGTGLVVEKTDHLPNGMNTGIGPPSRIEDRSLGGEFLESPA